MPMKLCKNMAGYSRHGLGSPHMRRDFSDPTTAHEGLAAKSCCVWLPAPIFSGRMIR